MREIFRDGGWGMWPTFLFSCLTILASLRYAMRPSRRLVGLQVSLGLLTLFSGALGFVTGVIRTLSVASGDPIVQWMQEFNHPDGRQMLAMKGTAESLNNVGLALAALCLAMICATVGVLRSGSDRRSGVEPARGVESAA